MRTKFIAGVVLAALTGTGFVRADDADVAQAIQAIAARRAEKDAAREKQSAQWAGNEARENGWARAGQAGGAVNPGVRVLNRAK